MVALCRVGTAHHGSPAFSHGRRHPDGTTRSKSCLMRLFAAILVLSMVRGTGGAAEISPADREFFESKIRPLLIEQCQSCHGDAKQKGGLRLDSRAALLTGGDSGPAIEGKELSSLLVEVVEYTGDYKMPPKAKLPEEQIEAIREWVRRGSPWPESAVPQPGAGTGKKVDEFDLAARKQAHWSFQPLTSPNPPDGLFPAGWVDGPTDRFLAARWLSEGLTPAPLADRAALLRRVTFDVTGLPPTVAELEAFLADESPEAWAKVVDRLLASPRYGERWARHWLDLVRFAETAGHEFDFEMPYAYEYRDYVIRALNADVPYNQFVLEHVAGDLLEAPRRNPEEGYNESVIGTGFWFLGESKHSPVDVRGDEAERVDNQLDVFGKTFLGLTLGCARCHDHKFDAISTKDYYALCGFLQSGRYDLACADDPAPRRAILNEISAIETQSLEYDRKIAAARDVKGAIARRLSAAIAAIRRAKETGGDVAEARAAAEKEAGLPAGELTGWVDELTNPGPDFSRGPLAPVARLLAADSLDPARWQAFHTECRAAATRQAEWTVRAEKAPWNLSERDRLGVPSRWTTTGEAFGAGWALWWDVPAVAAGRITPPPMLDRLASSRTLLNEFQGTLRSPTFEIREPFILYQLAGEKSRVNLILDGFQQIRNPIYGGLTIHVNEPGWKWAAQDLSKWIGHRAYIEFIDEGDGGIDIGEIIPSSSPQPPSGIEPLAVALGARPEPLAGVEELVAAVAEFWNVRGDLPTVNALPGTRRALLAEAPQATDRPHLSGTARAALGAKVRYGRKVMAMADGTPEDERVHLRGNHKKLGEVAPRRFLEAFVGNDVVPAAEGTGRLRLARQMVDPQVTPLLPRVIVNRLWQHLFGEGLVATPDDFGNMGRAPTHPELLDYLAQRLLANGWSLKAVQRELLLSRAYRQASHHPDSNVHEKDPANLALSRARIRRLEAETIRDSMLAVSGRLSERGGGRGTLPHLTAFMLGRGRPGGSGPIDGEGRRSIYQNVRRNFLSPFLLVFDAPVPFATIGRRSVSNVPAQSLALLNNPFVLDQSRVWGQRVAAMEAEPAEKVRLMFLTAFSRAPEESEQAEAVAFITEQLTAGTSPETAWSELAHVLFNVKEFIYLK